MFIVIYAAAGTRSISTAEVHNFGHMGTKKTMHAIEQEYFILHLDHLGPLVDTSKSYKFIFAVVDGFSKFNWLFTTKSTDVQEVIKHMQTWIDVFGSPGRLISDLGSAFTA